MDRMRVRTRPGALVVLVGSLGLAAACDSPTAMSAAQDIATSLSITINGADPSQDAEQLVLQVGDTISLSAVATNPLGLAVPGGTVSWSSTNTSVAEIDASGLVSAVGAGTAEIRAVSGEAVSALPTVVEAGAAL